MKSTTVRIDDPLLSQLKKLTAPGKTITSLIRSVLEKEIHKRMRIQAAETYRDYLEKNPKAREEMDSWGNAPLDTDLKSTQKSQ